MTIHKTIRIQRLRHYNKKILNHNHLLSLVPRNFSKSNYPQSPIQHILTQQSNVEDTHEQIIEQSQTTNFRSENNHSFWHTMSRQVGSFHRSVSYPANLQSSLPVIPLFAFPTPESPHHNNSAGMDSDNNSNFTVYNTASQINNSDLETPDKFDNSERSPSTFSQPPFQPLHSQIRFEIPSPLPSFSNVKPTYSPLTSESSDNNSSVNTQISLELDNFITLQRQLQNPQTLTIHQLSQSIISTNPSTPTPSSNYTPSRHPTSSSNPSSSSTNRFYRSFKTNFPNTPFPSHPGTARTFVKRPHHTITTEFLQVCLPFFPQNL